MTQNDYALDIEEIGVPRGEGESWGELVERRCGGPDRSDWHSCSLCSAEYRSRAAALRCCSERLD